MNKEHDEKTGQCSYHPELMKCLGDLVKEVVGLRKDNKWWLRLGGGMFTIALVLVGLTVPRVESIISKINALETSNQLFQKELEILKATQTRIIIQRNYDHKNSAPLQ